MEILSECITLKGGSETLGRSLEVITRGLLKLRLDVLAEAANQQKQVLELKLHDVLRLLDFSLNPKIGDSVQGILTKSIVFPIRAIEKKYSKPLPDSHKMKMRTKFLTAANEIVLGEDDSCAFVSLHKKEFADVALLLRSPTTSNQNNTFLLILECKSAKISMSEPQKSRCDKYTFSDLPSKGSQAKHLASLVKDANLMDDKLVTPGSVLDALKKGNYLYVYMSTKSDESFSVGNNVLVMGKDDCFNYLSFFKPLYELMRSGSSAASLERE
jgi:hypothetical protein